MSFNYKRVEPAIASGPQWLCQVGCKNRAQCVENQPININISMRILILSSKTYPEKKLQPLQEQNIWKSNLKFQKITTSILQKTLIINLI